MERYFILGYGALAYYHFRNFVAFNQYFADKQVLKRWLQDAIELCCDGSF